jgi:hypothetical protein
MCTNHCSSSLSKTYTDLCNSQAPILEHLAYVVPDTLPILRIDADSWQTAHTPNPATMAASDYKQYKKIQADIKFTMPGRLGVKESLHSMFMHKVYFDQVPELSNIRRAFHQSRCFHRSPSGLFTSLPQGFSPVSLRAFH